MSEAGSAHRRGRVRTLAAMVLAAALVAVLGMQALGHARLTRTFPADQAELSTVPQAVCLWFSEPVERAFSRFEVRDAAGQRVDDQEAWRNSELSKGASDHVVVPLLPIGPGEYTVTWEVLSVDTHRTRGEFRFTVLPGAEAAQGEDAGQNGCVVPVS